MKLTRLTGLILPPKSSVNQNKMLFFQTPSFPMETVFWKNQLPDSKNGTFKICVKDAIY